MQDAGKERILTVLLFLALSAVDVALNAAAGPAAVATGAHVNDSSSGGDGASGRALGIGAVSGATKAGILAFVGFLEFADIGVASRMLLIIVATVFGLSVLITAQVCSVVLGETPSELLKAALVAALPLQFESVGMYISITEKKTSRAASAPSPARTSKSSGGTPSAATPLRAWPKTWGAPCARPPPQPQPGACTVSCRESRRWWRTLHGACFTVETTEVKGNTTSK
ncbi:hypothetical protein RB601_006174 [Gaeumannomyces tritici]